MHPTQSALTSIDRQEPFSAPLPVPRSQIVRRDNESVIVESRHTNGETWAVLMPQPGSHTLTGPFIASATGVARQLYGRNIRVASPALTPDECLAFTDAGFQTRTSLHLLVADLRTTAPLASVKTVPAMVQLTTFRPRHEAAVLATDLAAFGAGHEMDALELASAFRATPSSRLRVARVNGDVVGFVLFGRADRRGYLQRLAVHPSAQGQGVGRHLILDGFGWCRLRRVQRVVVNTEHGNKSALHLYTSLGFELSPMELCIMEHKAMTPTDCFDDRPAQHEGPL